MHEAFRRIGFDGLMRSDHVPTLHGEVGAQAGYGVLGRLYAAGYIRGLIEGTATRSQARHASGPPTPADGPRDSVRAGISW